MAIEMVVWILVGMVITGLMVEVYRSRRKLQKSKSFNKNMIMRAQRARREADLCEARAEVATQSNLADYAIAKIARDTPDRIPSDLKKQIDAQGEEMARVISMRSVAEDAEMLVREIDERGDELCPHIHIETTYPVGVHLSVHVDRKDEFIPILKRIRELGYRRLEMHERPDQQIMEWRYRRPKDEGDHLRLIFKATFNADEKKQQSCRYVRTGTRTVEEPIYELVCDEDEAEEVAA